MTMASGRASAPLDEDAFKHFAPLLKASQDYASHSGCRFRSGSFDGIPTVAATAGSGPPSVGRARAGDSGPRLAAKIKASPVVDAFAKRLRAGEPGLAEELERAFRIVMVESVRNAMMGMCQALDMFPPTPPPSGVDDEDCSYEDTSAPLPIISQRLYNDQVRRVSDTSGGPARLEQRAMTAAFIVDFAEVIGVPLPEISGTQKDMLNELTARVKEETDRQGKSEAETSMVRDAFLSSLGAGAAAESLRAEAKKWWAENWKKAVAATAVTALGGVLGLGIVALYTAHQKRQAEERRRSQGGGGSDL